MDLQLTGITKRFGELVANDEVDLEIRSGEIHALLGENGAGKSTLMNILYGLEQPDSGELRIDGEVKSLRGPGDAIDAGIGMVHQHFMLVPVFTVTENIMLGNEWCSGPFGRLSKRVARETVQKLSEKYGLAVDPDKLVGDLPVGIQQRVEILKALVRNARVLILDEPTAVLTPQEIEDLVNVMRQLKKDGTSIVFITHKLAEVRDCADRITIMRRGKVVGQASPTSTESELARLMVGRDISLEVAKEPAEPGSVVLEIRDLVVRDDRDHLSVNGVSLDVRAGEILGIAGVQGNGQEELVEALVGLRKPESGGIILAGENIAGATPRAILDRGVGYVPEDRHRDGVIGSFSVAENLMLDMYTRPPFSNRTLLADTEINGNAGRQIAEFDIRVTDASLPVSTLSGGNQQKVVIAREFSRPLNLLIASQPTRGVDVGARSFIHQRIVAERDRGTAVVIVSTELDEVLGLADRVAVMYRGRIIGLLDGATDRESVGLLMAGIAPAPEVVGS